MTQPSTRLATSNTAFEPSTRSIALVLLSSLLDRATFTLAQPCRGIGIGLSIGTIRFGKDPFLNGGNLSASKIHYISFVTIMTTWNDPRRLRITASAACGILYFALIFHQHGVCTRSDEEVDSIDFLGLWQHQL